MINKLFFVLILCMTQVSWAEVKLNVERFEQKYQYSCEAAALRIVMNYHGVKLSEDEIIKKMPFDPTENRDGVWGDPDKAFVGKIDGRSAQESYGIHWGPMQTLASHWKKAEIIENGTLKKLIESISQNLPVIVWIYTGEKIPLNWKTSEGKNVNAFRDEHTIVISGYKGRPTKIEGFYVADPSKKNIQFLKTKNFLEIWSSFANKGLVIRP